MTSLFVVACACTPVSKEDPPTPVQPPRQIQEPTPPPRDERPDDESLEDESLEDERSDDEAIEPTRWSPAPGPVECAARPAAGWSAVPKQALSRLVDECALEIAAKLVAPVLDHSRKPAEWAAPQQVAGLPFVRLISAEQVRYPRTKVIDAYRGRVLDVVDAAVMNELLRDAGVEVESTARAKVLGRAFLSVGDASYRAKNVVLRARKSRGGFTVTGTYERTLVWSPPHNDMIAGSRTAQYGVELFFTREGGFELRRDEELRELRTSPPR